MKPMIRNIAAVIGTVIILGLPLTAKSAEDNAWDYSASVYLWGAGIQGSLANGAEVDASFGDILEELEFAIMGTYEARKGKWSVIGDVIYLDLAIEKLDSGA